MQTTLRNTAILRFFLVFFWLIVPINEGHAAERKPQFPKQEKREIVQKKATKRSKQKAYIDWDEIIPQTIMVLYAAVAIALPILKLVGMIAISWFWALFPIILVASLVLLFLIFALIVWFITGGGREPKGKKDYSF